MNLLNTIKNFIDEPTKPKNIIEPEIIKPEIEKVTLTPFEEKLNFLYMGCYNVNPTNPVITQELGIVQNQKDCINLGKTNGYKYVALQGGNQCLGANNLNLSNLTSLPRTKCNMVCDESSAGFCGGVLKNQIYATSLPDAVSNEYHQNIMPTTETSTTPTTTPTTTTTTNNSGKINSNNTGKQTENNKETFKHLENFVNTNREINNIKKHICQNDMVCQIPINKFNLFLVLLIILFLGYLIVEIIYKKNNF
jgi:hypothetical protein